MRANKWLAIVLKPEGFQLRREQFVAMRFMIKSATASQPRHSWYKRTHEWTAEGIFIDCCRNGKWLRRRLESDRTHSSASAATAISEHGRRMGRHSYDQRFDFWRQRLEYLH
jgi:hypothetical protein